MLSGSTDNNKLNERRVNIWNEWATKEKCAEWGRQEGDLGPAYGHQWRNYGATEDRRRSAPGIEYWSEERERWVNFAYFNDGVDQIQNAIDLIGTNPNSRRIIVSGWNPREATKVALPPCHTLFQFYVSMGKLSCHLYQRSGDVFLGVPFNIASYALLTSMVAQATGLELGEFVHTFGDVHIYQNHIEQVKTQLERAPLDPPKLYLNPNITDIFDFTSDDISIYGYEAWPVIKAPVSV